LTKSVNYDIILHILPVFYGILSACPVTYHQNPLRLNVGYLFNQPNGTSRDIPVDDVEFKFSEDFASQPLSGTINIGRTSQGILVTGAFSTRIPLDCVKCLAAFQFDAHAEFSEVYAFPWKSAGDSDLVVSEDADIDLLPVVREYLLLDIPIRPVCREGCKGLCSECGGDLNVSPCEHGFEKHGEIENEPDTRLAQALRKALMDSS